jgi:hypothetical protein
LLVLYSVLWILISTYRSVRHITSLIILGKGGQLNSESSSKFRAISGVFVRGSLVSVGLKHDRHTKFEWGTGPKIGAKPDRSKMRA